MPATVCSIFAAVRCLDNADLSLRPMDDRGCRLYTYAATAGVMSTVAVFPRITIELPPRLVKGPSDSESSDITLKNVSEDDMLQFTRRSLKTHLQRWVLNAHVLGGRLLIAVSQKAHEDDCSKIGGRAGKILKVLVIIYLKSNQFCGKGQSESPTETALILSDPGKCIKLARGFKDGQNS